MRAWLLLLAVLATFKPIVQVASTEDTASTIFIRAITPREEHIYSTADNSDDNTKAIRTELLAATTKTKTIPTTNAFGRAFNIEFEMSSSSSDAIESSKLTYETSDNETTNRKSSTTTTALSVVTTQRKNKKQQQHKRHHHHNNRHQQQQQYEQHQETQYHQEENSRAGTHDASATSTETTTTTPAASDESIQNSEKSTAEPTLDPPSTPITSAPSNDPEDEHETYSNKEIINEKAKPDPEVLVEIENSLLSLFNMKRPPKIDRSKIIIPEAMKKLYEEIMNQQVVSVNLPKPGLLTKSANTVRSFTHQDSKIDHRFPHHHRFRLYFDVKSVPQKEKLKAAELHLARDAISHASLNPIVANRTRYQVLAYDITRVGIHGKREPSYLLLDNKTIRLNSTDTISVDIQPAVERWLEHPERNYGLLIEVRTSGALKPAPHHHVRLRRSVDEPHDDWKHKQPLLFTYTDDGRHKARSIRDVSMRSKRADHHQHRRGRRRKTHDDCRRHSLYVDFSDVGWSDWIVAPPGYDAFYCHGKCPFGLFEHLNATNHAVVQTLVNNLNPAKVPKPCCVPTQLDGISMLYLNDQNTVVLKNYQDMTVVGCGCR